MNNTARQIEQLNTETAVIGDHARVTFYVDGQPYELPSRAELRAYLAALAARYAHWADRPAESEAPLFDRPPDDQYIETLARPLPMRVSVHRAQPGMEEAPAYDLVEAIGEAKRTIILGEPGSGTTALERLAWLTATQSMALAEDQALTIPIWVRLADYQGEADLIPLLRRSLNRVDALALNDLSTRQLLWAKNVHFVWLLDGLNEFERAFAVRGRGAIRRSLDDYPGHTVHVSCRTADFDLDAEMGPATRMLPEALLWVVQPLVDEIRYWGDGDGQSDVRDYLRQHLGLGSGKRLYEHLRGDERLADMARLPLFLWMFKEAAGGQDGELPTDRGSLLRQFVRAPRLLGRVPKPMRSAAERCLEAVGWAMQCAGTLELETDDLDDALVAAQGRRSFDLDEMVAHLCKTGLLIDLGEERYRLLHQLVQEYAAAAHLVRQLDCDRQLATLARDAWWRESCVAALWLDDRLHDAEYLLGLMGEAKVDLRVRVTAATVLAEVGDPRFDAKTVQVQVLDRESGATHNRAVAVIEPAMVEIAGGKALLGGEDSEAHSNELPGCGVTVGAFALAVYPVTNREYGLFVDADGYEDVSLWTVDGQAWLRGEGSLDDESKRMYRSVYQALVTDVEGEIANQRQTQALDDEDADFYRQIASDWTEDQFLSAYTDQILGEQRRTPFYWTDSRYNQPGQPVVGINWYEAMAYASWMAKIMGRAYRLPTEVEWEWAARRSMRRYPWGDEWDSAYCNWSGSGLNRASPVGVYANGRTPDGLHDLAGNVYEWTSTLYRPYPYAAEDGRENVEGNGLRVVRGGSWYDGNSRVRCAYRCRLNPWSWSNLGGMRLARSLSS